MTYYEILEVSRSASPQVIRAAYRSLMQTHHPDKNDSSPEAVEKTQRVALAYQILSDHQLRAAYDASLPVLVVHATPDSSIYQPLHVAPHPPIQPKWPVRLGLAAKRQWFFVLTTAVLVAFGVWLVQQEHEYNLPNARLAAGWAAQKAASEQAASDKKLAAKHWTYFKAPDEGAPSSAENAANK